MRSLPMHPLVSDNAIPRNLPLLIAFVLSTSMESVRHLKQKQTKKITLVKRPRVILVALSIRVLIAALLGVALIPAHARDTLITKTTKGPKQAINATGTLDFDQAPFVPTFGHNAYVFIVPKKNDYTAARVFINVDRGAQHLGRVNGAMMYWLHGELVLGFNEIEVAPHKFSVMPGYIVLARMPLHKRGKGALTTGDWLYANRGDNSAFPVVNDLWTHPPEDYHEADGD